MADDGSSKTGFWDPRIANTASAIEHCLKMGGVILKPERQTGFGGPPERPRPLDTGEKG